ncbi:aldo/keto reductase [Acidothermaceae bacterium B102]|nr:aldo/keto reductase [Acidothermaceae bacterium B102]
MLNDGHRMPRVGLGTYPLDDRAVADTIVAATAMGYRLIDTAVRYDNEVGVGNGIRACGVPRGELFVTTKLDGEFQGGERAIAGLEASLQRLRLDYVDLVLIHWPLPQRSLYVNTWHTFRSLQQSGLARSIGVSNFKPAHLERLSETGGVPPAVNQIQLSASLHREASRAYHDRHGIVTQAWSPLAPGTGLVRHAGLGSLAAKHGRAPAQIALRWLVQVEATLVVKSADPLRLRDNLDVFGFALSPEDMAVIATLDRGEAAAEDSDVVGH